MRKSWVVILDPNVVLPDSVQTDRGALIQNNVALIKHIASKGSKFDQVVLALGSSQQSCEADREFRRRRTDQGLFAPPAAAILPAFQAALAQRGLVTVIDGFLLADIFGRDRQGGENFKAMLEGVALPDRAVYEEKRIALIYAQVHRAAVLNPDSEVVVDFYTRRHDILGWLACFYEQNVDWIPQGVQLGLHQDRVGQDSLTFDAVSIQGQGPIDQHYDWSLRFMALTCESQDEDFEAPTLRTLEADDEAHQDQRFMRLVKFYYYHPEIRQAFVDFRQAIARSPLSSTLSSDRVVQYSAKMSSVAYGEIEKLLQEPGDVQSGYFARLFRLGKVRSKEDCCCPLIPVSGNRYG